MSESDTVAVVLTITKKDYAAAVRGMMNPTTARLLKMLLCVSLAVLVYFAYESARTWTVSNFVRLLWGFGVALPAAYFIFFLPLVAASEFVRKNPDQLGPTNQKVTPSGVFKRECTWPSYFGLECLPASARNAGSLSLICAIKLRHHRAEAMLQQS